MALPTATTAAVVKEYQRSANDTGSTEVQVALLTERIRTLTEHMKKNKNDTHTRYGLTKLVSQRRKLMSYLKRVDLSSYLTLIKKLDIRG